MNLARASSHRKLHALVLCLLMALAPGGAFADEPTSLRGRPAARPSGPAAKLDSMLRQRHLPARSGDVVVITLRLRGGSDAVIRELTARGLTVSRTDDTFTIVEGKAAASDLEAIAAHDAVTSVREIEGGTLRAGAVMAAGDAASGLDQVRATGLDGTGVTVGVLSNGLGGLAASQASGDLPQVLVPADPRCKIGAGNEGTAVLEIVHDVAPGATLLFASGVESPLHFVDALACLVDAGADVIVDDIGFFTEPYFEDGIVAKAVRKALDAGVSMHTAAGNSALLHFEDDFRTSPDDFHDFLADATVDNMNGIALDAGGRVACVLQWDEPFGAADDDYDLELRDAATLEILAESRNVQDGTQDPLELATFRNDGASTRTLGIAIQRIAGEARRLKLFCFGTGLSMLQYHDQLATVVGHPAVEGVLALGAVDVAAPGRDRVEAFSARGPAYVRFPAAERRDKPDLVGFDAVATTVPGYAIFYGTSAAAPQSAGLAALLKQRRPDATPREVYDAITAGAIELGAPGFDYVTGYGLLDGPGALAALEAPECSEDADCADEDVCTTERCERGACVVRPRCDDGNPCNGTEGCDAGACRPASALPDGAPCDDGDACNGDERCHDGACGAGSALVCRDDDPCSVDGCDAAVGCAFAAVAGLDAVTCRLRAPLPACADQRMPRFVARAFARAERRIESGARPQSPRVQRRRLEGVSAQLESAIQRLQRKVERQRLPASCAEALAARLAAPAAVARQLADSL